MNSRVLELAIQAGLKKPHASDREYIGDFDWRHFAELIVLECIDCLKPLSRNHSMVGAAQDTIKEHFGVEE